MKKKYQPPRMKVEGLKLHTQFCSTSATLGTLNNGGELESGYSGSLGGYHTTSGQENYPLLAECDLSSWDYPLGSANDYAYGKAYYAAVKSAIEAAGGTMPSYIWSSSQSNTFVGVYVYVAESVGVQVNCGDWGFSRYVRPFLAF